MLETADTSKTRATDKSIPSFYMDRAPPKHTIFEMIPGANEKRFIAYNDMPECNSRYKREQVSIVDFTNVEGREKPVELNPEP